MEFRSPDFAEDKSRGNDVVFEIVVRIDGIGWSFRTGWEKPLKNFGDASLHPREFLSDFGKCLPLLLCFLFRCHSILLQTF